MADVDADVRVRDFQDKRASDGCRHRYSLVPRFDRRNDPLDAQLEDLVWVADRLGMAEAAGWIERLKP